MSQVKGRLARLSKRTKFKDPNTIEIVILDHETQEEFSIFWQFREDKVEQTVKSKKVEKEVKDND